MPSSAGAARPGGLAQRPIGEWVLEESSDPQFRYRLRIYTRDPDRPMLSLFVQDRWPGGSQHIFCLREARLNEVASIGGEVERVPVVAIERYARRLRVVLGRPTRKRCDFQIVERRYKNPPPNSPPNYEQIFWFTQTAMRQRRPRGARLKTARVGTGARIHITADERYPWHLSQFVSERGSLPAGDYALVERWPRR